MALALTFKGTIRLDGLERGSCQHKNWAWKRCGSIVTSYPAGLHLITSDYLSLAFGLRCRPQSLPIYSLSRRASTISYCHFWFLLALIQFHLSELYPLLSLFLKFAHGDTFSSCTYAYSLRMRIWEGRRDVQPCLRSSSKWRSTPWRLVYEHLEQNSWNMSQCKGEVLS